MGIILLDPDATFDVTLYQEQEQYILTKFDLDNKDREDKEAVATERTKLEEWIKTITPSVFTCVAVDGLLRAFIEDSFSKPSDFVKETEEKEEEVTRSRKSVNFAKFGLRSWTNVKDNAGKDILLELEEVNVPNVGKRICVKDSCLRRIPIIALLQIGMSILIHSTLSGTEQKN